MATGPLFVRFAAGQTTYEQGINQFSDQTDEELTQLFGALGTDKQELTQMIGALGTDRHELTQMICHYLRSAKGEMAKKLAKIR